MHLHLVSEGSGVGLCQLAKAFRKLLFVFLIFLLIYFICFIMSQRLFGLVLTGDLSGKSLLNRVLPPDYSSLPNLRLTCTMTAIVAVLLQQRQNFSSGNLCLLPSGFIPCVQLFQFQGKQYFSETIWWEWTQRHALPTPELLITSVKRLLGIG